LRAVEIFDTLNKKGDEVEFLERYDERIKMYELMDNLIAKSGGRLKNRDEVFGEFAKAHFSGNYLPLARMVENTLSKGSFRELANKFSIEPEKNNGIGAE
jgi:ribosome-associated toxin RatA of RatAB toxin-antitoxin module